MYNVIKKGEGVITEFWAILRMDVDDILKVGIFLTILSQIQKANFFLFIVNFFFFFLHFLTFELLHCFFETYFVITL